MRDADLMKTQPASGCRKFYQGTQLLFVDRGYSSTQKDSHCAYLHLTQLCKKTLSFVTDTSVSFTTDTMEQKLIQIK